MPLGDGEVEGRVVAVVQGDPVPVRALLQEEGHDVVVAGVSCVVQSCPARPALSQRVDLCSPRQTVLRFILQYIQI